MFQSLFIHFFFFPFFVLNCLLITVVFFVGSEVGASMDSFDVEFVIGLPLVIVAFCDFFLIILRVGVPK